MNTPSRFRFRSQLQPHSRSRFSNSTVFIAVAIFLAAAISGGGFFMVSPTQAHAGFFDDLVNFINPVNQVNDLLNGKLPIPPSPIPLPVPIAGNLTLIPLPIGIGTPTLPNLSDLLTPPLKPIVQTKEATDITSHSAVIKGYADPNGSPDTVAYFNWGKTTEMGNTTGTIAIPPPAAEFQVTLNNLSPNTTYYYRADAKNFGFTVKDDIKSFTTLGTSTPPVTCPTGQVLVNGVCKTPQQPMPIEGNCTGSPSSAMVGQTVTWSANQLSGGNGTYAFSWSGSGGLTGTAQSVQTSYTSAGQENATVKVTSDGQWATFSCSVTVYTTPPTPTPLEAFCSANPSSVVVGSLVTWTATPTGGTGSYTYVWSGDDNLDSSTNQSVTHVYYTDGTFNAHVTVSSGNQIVAASCSVTVTPPASGGGPGPGPASGGLNQPEVSIVNQTFVPVPQSVSAPVPPSYVYLSQVPYTGLADYPPSYYFMVGLALWSALMSVGYFWLRRKRFSKKSL